MVLSMPTEFLMTQSSYYGRGSLIWRRISLPTIISDLPISGQGFYIEQHSSSEQSLCYFVYKISSGPVKILFVSGPFLSYILYFQYLWYFININILADKKKTVYRSFIAPSTETQKALQDVLLENILHNSLTFHFWNSVTFSLIPEPDSLVSKLLNYACIRCSELP